MSNKQTLSKAQQELINQQLRWYASRVGKVGFYAFSLAALTGCLSGGGGGSDNQALRPTDADSDTSDAAANTGTQSETGFTASGNRFEGTDNDDILSEAESSDNLVVSGEAGADTILTGSGNDIVRPGQGADTVNTGEGDDIIVVVGTTTANQYVAADITNPAGTGIDLSSVLDLESLNNQTISEAVAGESLNGGSGNNTLFVYGTADFTGISLANLTQVVVNSDVTFEVSQLAVADSPTGGGTIKQIQGDGESIIRLSNPDDTEVSINFSNLGLSNIKQIDIGENVRLVIDDVAAFQASGIDTISGTGALELGNGIFSTDLGEVDISDDLEFFSGELIDFSDSTDDLELFGTEGNDQILSGSGNDRLDGLEGSDFLEGGNGNDVLRGGAGVDQMYGGEGDDAFVIVGDLSGGGKVDSAEDTEILGFPLTDLNGQTFNEDEDGSVEIIAGGEGENDTIYVYGTADISNDEITGVEKIEIRSDVTVDAGFFSTLTSARGDGGSILRLKSLAEIVVEVTGIILEGMGTLDVGEGVTLDIESIDDLGGASVLTGGGTIRSTVGDLDLTGFTLDSKISVLDSDGSPSEGGTVLDEIIESDGSKTDLVGTDGNDLIEGSNIDETFNGLGGDDIIRGLGGNDTFIIDENNSGTKNISDSSGNDTLDLFNARGPADLDLAVGGMVGGVTVELNQSGFSALDLFLLQDLSGSFGDDVVTVQNLLEGEDGLINRVRELQADSNFGAGSFVDKPVDPFGDSSSGDYVYQTEIAMRRDENEFIAAVDAMIVRSGNDGPEAQLEALFQTALRSDTSEIGFRPDALRLVLLTTDADYHQAGDHASAGENNGDTVLDGTPPGTGEDYPTVAQVREAVQNFGIYPVFAVTSDDIPTYQDLVAQLGVGDVVELSSDSSNIIDAIETALGTVDLEFLENVIGTGFDDNILGNSLNNELSGEEGDDILEGSAGNDVLSGGVGNDQLDGGDDNDGLLGDEGDDILLGGDGNDILFGGLGLDELFGEDGDDVLVALGTTTADQYEESDITNPAGTGIDLSNFLTLDQLNGRDESDVVVGEIYDGGLGNNTLLVFGNTDFTDVVLANINQVDVNSDITLGISQLTSEGGSISGITGDGDTSILRLVNNTTESADIYASALSLSDIHQLDIGADINFVIEDINAWEASSIDIISGEGSLSVYTDTGIERWDDPSLWTSVSTEISEDEIIDVADDSSSDTMDVADTGSVEIEMAEVIFDTNTDDIA